MDYMTTDGTVVKLAPPHDFNSAQTIAQDLIPNINGILNSVHSVGGDGSYVYRDGSWQYQPQLNSFYFNSSAQQQQNKNEQRIPASQMHRLNGMPGAQATPQQQAMNPQMTSGMAGSPFMRSFNPGGQVGANNNPQWSRIG